jgi:predicted Zn-dependent protease
MRINLLAMAALWAAAGCALQVFAADGSMGANHEDAFRSEAAAEYRKILFRLSARGKLDDHEALLLRVRKIGAGLIIAAASQRAETSEWRWEIHVTSEPAVGAICMAGGKILVGSAVVTRLQLTDGELAMMLGHEIAHAVMDHRREIARSTIDSDAAEDIRQAGIAVKQESEADRIGMGLAYRAGWPAASLVSFFDKLSAAEPPGTFNSSHPDAASRASAARLMALELEARATPMKKPGG